MYIHCKDVAETTEEPGSQVGEGFSLSPDGPWSGWSAPEDTEAVPLEAGGGDAVCGLELRGC